MAKDKLTEESKVFVFDSATFCGMLRDRGDEDSLSLAAKVEETFTHAPEFKPTDMEQVHDEQGIPKDGQEAG